MTTTIALVTGANKGIGLETARQFGARGFTVLAGARDKERGLAAERELRADGSWQVHFITHQRAAANAIVAGLTGGAVAGDRG